MTVAERILENIFEPVHEFGPYTPILLGLAVIVAFILSAWIVFELISHNRDKSAKRTRFDQNVGRMNLSRKEKTFLLQAVVAGNLHDPTRLLRRPSEFDRWMSRFEASANPEERRIIDALRKKLFGANVKAKGWKSTRDFDSGWRMSLRVSGNREALVEGYLASVDNDGLVLSIDSLTFKGEKTEWLTESIAKGMMVRLQGKKRTIHVPLEPQSRLEIHLTAPDGQIFHFSTYLQTVIPGPQKMLKCDHSNMIHLRGKQRRELTKKNFNASTVRSVV